MATASQGGSFLPAASYNTTGDWSFAGTVTTSGNTKTSKTVGTVGASTVSAVEYGDGIFHKTVLTLTALSVSLSDTNVGGGSKIYTFPEGDIAVLGAVATVAETTTSVLASTLNASKTLSVGVGSVQTTTQASGTLTTTEQDIVNQFSATSSATINVAGASASGKLTATTLTRYDGTATAQAVYLNVGVPTATDIDGDATTTFTGTVTITWAYIGDV